MGDLALPHELQTEYAIAFVQPEVEDKILVDQGDGQSAAKKMQDLVVEDPIGDQPERKDDDGGGQQIAIGVEMVRPRAGGLNGAQHGQFEEGQQHQGQGQGIEHEQYPCNVVDGIVPRDVFEQIVDGIEHVEGLPANAR